MNINRIIKTNKGVFRFKDGDVFFKYESIELQKDKYTGVYHYLLGCSPLISIYANLQSALNYETFLPESTDEDKDKSRCIWCQGGGLRDFNIRGRAFNKMRDYLIFIKKDYQLTFYDYLYLEHLHLKHWIKEHDKIPCPGYRLKFVTIRECVEKYLKGDV